ncbi:glycosyltransferase family 2 protein [Lichenicola cladoniae]|uniref:Glycosyltransferase family 2 protein n=1 Tax=Lichenicola cladoniae TaxID=1484109 RepID=A0A6M8HSB9_9PROT|nr:glycosyltransferase family 2 protein [Lichenicola cladoniae]NPD65753.1 glycosyltransferase family 2 protein [Acetobacteraceae bacterium]QKE91230.1 glycosyltransferase family 2 protein [Lichenicola cladoniae]
MTASPTHLVLIPSYNTGARLIETVREATAHWSSVWVVIDGSTDGSERGLDDAAARLPGLRVLALDQNRGKGAAILHGLKLAATAGFTHVLTMDADGQHPANHIGRFMAASRADPAAMILGRPVFDEHAPALRVQGRRISNWWANVETPGCSIEDSLFGFRVYPIADLVAVMDGTRWMRRFDFDPEAAVRLCWRGLRSINLAAPVRYLRADEGGVSHFHYGRDNLLLAWMHLRLVLGALSRLMRRPRGSGIH